MSEHRNFNIGFLKTSADEHMFLSVTPGFERGPGILRDGITRPRMTDPHHVEYVRHAFGLRPLEREYTHPTEDASLQRAGTWTLYHHLDNFIKAHGKEWLVIGCQSCGDLTMNPWHVAYIGESHIPALRHTLCALSTAEDPPEHHESLVSRVYHALIKWSGAAAAQVGKTYSFLDIRISLRPTGVALVIEKQEEREYYGSLLKKVRAYRENSEDLSPVVEFALAGKPIVQHGMELSLSNAIDRFQDVRHVFNLPPVRARGAYKGREVDEVNIGEYQFFSRLNERRAALQSAVLIDLEIETNVTVAWEDLRSTLCQRHFREVDESPTRRGQFRRVNGSQVEIYYPHNVYPFGVLGLAPSGLVCLASGGLSGRVGNTLEGITRIMYDFFGCSDAMVLDEGFDTFQIVNPKKRKGTGYEYENEDIRAAALSLAHRLFESEAQQAPEHDGLRMPEWPLNEGLAKKLSADHKARRGKGVHADIMVVEPLRSQMRSVLIFAVEKKKLRDGGHA